MTNLISSSKLVAVLVAAALSTTSTLAQTSSSQGSSTRQTALLQDFGSAERIQQSGALRMLSQRISANVCNRVAGIRVADADKYLSRSLRDYRRILAGLENGDDGLGLYGPEDDRTVLRDLATLNELWVPVNTTLDTHSGDTLTREHAVLVASAVPALLDRSKELLGFVVAEYSDPTQMLQSDAVLLQIAERQRMLEQEIANATCMIGEDINVDHARAKLAEAVPLYTVSLAALREGKPEAGVAAPPTQAIDLWLADISDRWEAIRPMLETVSAGGDISPEDRTTIFEEMNKLTWMMNVTVGQYTEAAKLKRSFQE